MLLVCCEYQIGLTVHKSNDQGEQSVLTFWTDSICWLRYWWCLLITIILGSSAMKYQWISQEFHRIVIDNVTIPGWNLAHSFTKITKIQINFDNFIHISICILWIYELGSFQTIPFLEMCRNCHNLACRKSLEILFSA